MGKPKRRRKHKKTHKKAPYTKHKRVRKRRRTKRRRGRKKRYRTRRFGNWRCTKLVKHRGRRRRSGRLRRSRRRERYRGLRGGSASEPDAYPYQMREEMAAFLAEQANAVAAGAAGAGGTAAGWEAMDDGTGNVYYYNHDTGESSWTKPEEPMTPEEKERIQREYLLKLAGFEDPAGALEAILKDKKDGEAIDCHGYFYYDDDGKRQSYKLSGDAKKAADKFCKKMGKGRCSSRGRCTSEAEVKRQKKNRKIRVKYYVKIK